MPEDVKNQTEDQSPAAPSAQDDHADELETLRSELQTYKQNASTVAAEKQLLERRLEEREREFNQRLGRQGQELGNKIKALETTLTSISQPKADQPKKRNRLDENLTVPDPVTDPENFKRYQLSLLGSLQELQEQNEKLAAGGQITEVERRLKAEIEGLQYKVYLTEQEAKLRAEYQFDDQDLARVHDFMRDSNIYDPEAAAIKIPELKRKMFSSQAPRREEDLDIAPRRESEPKRKPKFDPVAAGREMLNTKSDRVPQGGGKNSADSELNWLEEGKAAVADGSFRSWPEAKQKEYERKLMQTLSANMNGASY